VERFKVILLSVLFVAAMFFVAVVQTHIGALQGESQDFIWDVLTGFAVGILLSLLVRPCAAGLTIPGKNGFLVVFLFMLAVLGVHASWFHFNTPILNMRWVQFPIGRIRVIDGVLLGASLGMSQVSS